MDSVLMWELSYSSSPIFSPGRLSQDCALKRRRRGDPSYIPNQIRHWPLVLFSRSFFVSSHMVTIGRSEKARRLMTSLWFTLFSIFTRPLLSFSFFLPILLLHGSLIPFCWQCHDTFSAAFYSFLRLPFTFFLYFRFIFLLNIDIFQVPTQPRQCSRE